LKQVEPRPLTRNTHIAVGVAGRVVVNIVAECAGVTELLQRKAGPWFGKFAKKIKRRVMDEASLSETLDVVMVCTHAWQNSSDRNAPGELVSDLKSDGILCKKVSSAFIFTNCREGCVHQLAVHMSMCGSLHVAGGRSGAGVV
jgi:hypothetical protein